MLSKSRDEPTFNIKGGSSEFGNKQKNIFDLLTLAEQGSTLNQNQSVPHFPDLDSQTRRRKRHETKQFKGKESLFKRPQELPPRFNKAKLKIPDFQKNPHRWTKYTLADVSSDDLSDTTNTNTALSFLNELKAKKLEYTKPNKEENEEETEKIKEQEGQSSKAEDKFTFKGSKIVMPEYVIGQKKPPAKKLKTTLSKNKEIKLDHLIDYEDD